MFRTITDRIRRSFSNSAEQYDLLTGLHKEIGRELVQKAVGLKPSVIVDAGCGTGYVTRKAKNFFPESRVVGIDIAWGMALKARDQDEAEAIDWMCADAARLPLARSSVDLLLSNLAYQWMADLPQAFREAERVLQADGVINLTLFGGRTCEELLLSLKSVDPTVTLRALPSLDTVRSALADADFNEIQMDAELIKVQFKDVMDLLGWLKAIGANHMGEHPVFLGKNKLALLEKYYRTHFPYHEGICASFEVIWAYAKK